MARARDNPEAWKRLLYALNTGDGERAREIAVVYGFDKEMREMRRVRSEDIIDVDWDSLRQPTMDFRHELVHFRERFKLRQIDLAQMIGSSRAAVMDYESHRRVPTEDKVTTLSMITGVDLRSVANFEPKRRARRPKQMMKIKTEEENDE